MALAVLCIVGVVVAVVFLTGGGSGHKKLVPTPPPAQQQQPQAPAFTVDEMHAALVSYATAFDDEDRASLQSLFADNLVRLNGNDPPENLSGALATYASQFARLSNPKYVLSNLSYSTQNGSASGIYTIDSDNAPEATGGIDFVFVHQNGRLFIGTIAISPG